MPLQRRIRRSIVGRVIPERSLRVSATSLFVREGGTRTLNVCLSQAPRAGQTVNVAVSIGDSTIATINKTSLTFNQGNFGVNQAITVTGVQDLD